MTSILLKTTLGSGVTGLTGQLTKQGITRWRVGYNHVYCVENLIKCNQNPNSNKTERKLL